MGRVLFDFVPKPFDGVQLRRIGRELIDRETVRLLGVEGVQRATDVIRHIILDQNDWPGDLGEGPGEKVLVRRGVELTFSTPVVERAPKAIEQPEDPIGPTDATRVDGGLNAFERPGVAQTTPLREARFAPNKLTAGLSCA